MTNRNMVKPEADPADAGAGAAQQLRPEPNRPPLPPMPAPESDPSHIVTRIEPEDTPGAAQAPDERQHRAGLRGQAE